MNVWDLSGHAEYQESRRGFYKDLSALLLVFDVSRLKTFDGLDAWIAEARKNSRENVPIWVAGNKTDLDGKRAVDSLLAADWARSRGYRGYSDVSAKEGVGVSDLFINIATHTD